MTSFLARLSCFLNILTLTGGVVQLTTSYAINSIGNQDAIGNGVTEVAFILNLDYDTFGLIRILENDGSDGDTVLSCTDLSACDESNLQNDLVGRATVNIDGDVITVTLSAYDSATDTPNYKCALQDSTFAELDESLITLPTVYETPPTSVDLTLPDISGDSAEFDEGDASITVTTTAFGSPAIYPSFTAWVDSVERSFTQDSDTQITLSLNDLSARSATYNVTIRTALWNVVEIRSLDVTIEKEKKDDKDDGPSDGVIAGAAMGSIAGVVIIVAIIIIVIMYIKKIGCFAKKGASSTAGSRKYQKKENNESQEQKNKKSDKDKKQPKDKDVEKNQIDQKDKSKDKRNKKTDKGIEQAKDKPVNKIQRGENNMPKEETNKKPDQDIEQP